MQIKNIILCLATSFAVAMADDYVTASSDETTTSTSTLTKTVTVTQCNPTISACPGYEASTTAPASSSSIVKSYPVLNSTSSVVYPTGGYSNHTSSFYTAPTSAGYPVETTGATPTYPAQPPASSIAEAGSGSVFVHSGLLLGIVGAGVALLA
ncbi:hypothetical protein V8F06_000236 [Rhypophila decipiens]